MTAAASKSHATGTIGTRRARRVSQAQREVIFANYIDWAWDEKSHAEGTSKQYRRIAMNADVWMLEHCHRSIFSATYKDFRKYLFDCKPTAPRRNQVRQALNAFLDYLVSEGYRSDNPTRYGGEHGKGLTRQKEPRQVVRVPERDDTRALWAEAKASEPRVAALVGLFLWGGLRRDEGRCLTWSQVERDSIYVHGKGGGRKEGAGRDRLVPIHPELAWALRRWRGECPDPHWVFPSPRHPEDPRPLSRSWVKRVIDDLGERTGIELHPHLMRHCIATEMLDKGGNLVAIQEFLGHASLQTTQIYVHVRSGRVAEAVMVANYEEPE